MPPWVMAGSPGRRGIRRVLVTGCVGERAGYPDIRGGLPIRTGPMASHTGDLCAGEGRRTGRAEPGTWGRSGAWLTRQNVSSGRGAAVFPRDYALRVGPRPSRLLRAWVPARARSCSPQGSWRHVDPAPSGTIVSIRDSTTPAQAAAMIVPGTDVRTFVSDRTVAVRIC